MAQNDKPVKKFRHLLRDQTYVEAAIWLQQEPGKKPRYVTQIGVSYKKEDGWHTVKGYSCEELPLVRLCAEEAYTWIHRNLSSSSTEMVGE